MATKNWDDPVPYDNNESNRTNVSVIKLDIPCFGCGASATHTVVFQSNHTRAHKMNVCDDCNEGLARAFK